MAALRRGATVEELYRRTWIDPWFLRQLEEIREMESDLSMAKADDRKSWLRPAKQMGFSDGRLAQLWNLKEGDVRSMRIDHDFPFDVCS